MIKINENILKEIKNKNSLDITVILNIWKRNHFIEQLNSILNQTLLPKEIWVIQYEKHIDLNNLIEEYKEFFSSIYHIHSSKNLKYFGRFSIAINVSTEYIFIVDDDVIPGRKWLENAFKKCNELNAIISCTGRILPKENFCPELPGTVERSKYFIGDMTYLFKNYCSKDTIVDYGCNSYFFKREWLSLFWAIWPTTFLSGEDMHLSASAKSIAGVETYVITQDDKDSCGNVKKAYGSDDVASWRQTNFVKLREQVLKFHVLEKGWKPILW
jgi:hypothetical protein